MKNKAMGKKQYYNYNSSALKDKQVYGFEDPPSSSLPLNWGRSCPTSRLVPLTVEPLALQVCLACWSLRVDI